MPTITDLPINFYSRTKSDSSGTAPAGLQFLCHADRASISGGTAFADHSPFNWSVYGRGSGIVQTSSAGYFGNSGILFTGNTTSTAAARIAWNFGMLTIGTFLHPFQFDNFIYFSTLNTATSMTWFELRDATRTNYAWHYIYSAGSAWLLHATWYSPALGYYFNHDWNLPTLTTGSYYHFALVRLGSVEFGPSLEGCIGAFCNGSQLTAVAGGFPTSGDVDNFFPCSFHQPTIDHLSYGGVADGLGGVNPFYVLDGKMDELRVLFNTTISSVAYDTLLSEYSFSVPTAPSLPVDGSFYTSFLSLSLSSSDLSPASSGLLNLGVSSSPWGTAFFNSVGQTFTVIGTSRIQFGTSSVYLFSSTSGYLTLVAGTQIDLQANVGMAGKNFIFDTATGVTIATATNQKLAFWGSTPIVKPTNIGVRAALTSAGIMSGAWWDFTITTTSAAIAVSTAMDILICDSGTAFNVTLPSAAGEGKVLDIKNVGTANVTIVADSSDLIDLASTVVLTSLQAIRIVNWSAPIPAVYGADVFTGGTPWANETTWGAAALACDNNTGTYWAIGGAATGLWAYDLGSGVTKTIQKLRIYPYGNPSNFIKNFEFGGSNVVSPTITDDTAWTTIYTGTDASSLGVWHEHTFTNATAYRYYRIKIIDGWAAGLGAAHEFEGLEMTAAAIPGKWAILGSYSS